MAQDIPRNVLVVIGVGGMGLPICRRLASGRRVILADYSETNLKAALTTLRSEGHIAEGLTVDIAEGLTVDIADFNAVSEVARVAGNTAHIDAIIHTAGVAPGSASSKQIFEIDLLGTANVIEAFLPVASPGTALVCIASMAGSMIELSKDLEKHLATAPLDQLLQHKELDLESSNPGMAYAQAKRGNQLRVQAAARAWGARGARLNSISPGVISTAIVQKDLEGPAGDRMRSMIEMSAARRTGTPDDIVNAAAFLVSRESDFITGNDILVDGGTVASRRWHSGA